MTDRIRVLALDQGAGVWGAQRYLVRLGLGLRDYGIDLVLATSPALDLPEVWQDAGLEYAELDLPTDRSVRDADGQGSLQLRPLAREAKATWRAARSIAESARSNNCSLIHANGHGVHLEAALAGRIGRRPAVMHLHEELEPLFAKAVRTSAVAAATHSVAVSNAVKAGVPGALRGKVTTIANGVDTESLCPGPSSAAVRVALGGASDEPLMVAVTRIDPDKQIADLLRAAAALPDRSRFHLAIVGVTSAYPEYEAEMRRLGRDLLGDRVTFAGRRSDIVEVLRCSDVVVHAGAVEGMPLGLLEAQSTGRPVIAYRVSGVPEAVVDGRTGLLANLGDVVGLSAHMANLLSDETLRARLGNEARRNAVERHDIQEQIRINAHLVARVCGRPLAQPEPSALTG